MIRLAHTAVLDEPLRAAARALLEDVFAGDLDEYDWEHALGGMHALAFDGGELVGHASVIQRRLIHGGRALRAGYVEGVGVRADRRGRGHGAAVMAAVEQVIAQAYEIGALGTTDEARGFYLARGWVAWRGPTSALTPDGVVRTAEEDGGVLVLPGTAPLDLEAALICDWRDGSPW